MVAMAVADLTKCTEAKWTIKELTKLYGDEVDRDTAMPIGHFIEAIDFILSRPKSGDTSGRRNALRDAVTLMLEFMGGFRIGEAAGGNGENHGIDANMVLIFHDYVELTLHDRKTCSHPITVTVARFTSGHNLDLGQLLLDYFEAWQIPVAEHAKVGDM